MISLERLAAQYRVTEAKTKRCEGTLRPLIPPPSEFRFVSSMRAVRSFGERDEAYRGRERARLTVTVTRYGNARNAPLYQFRFAARGRSRPERRSANSREDDDDRACKRKEIIIPRYANMQAVRIYAPARRGALRSLYRDIFGRPPLLSFFRVGKVERTCSPANTGREERERETR